MVNASVQSQLLVPTQRELDLCKLIELSRNFNMGLFEPIWVSTDNRRRMITDGHHRAALIHIASNAYGLDIPIPAKFLRHDHLGRSLFLYSERAADSLDGMVVPYSCSQFLLSDVHSMGSDVYARMSGCSELIFNLPGRSIFEELAQRYSSRLCEAA